MAHSVLGIIDFEPLPTLQEDEELVTLSDVLQLSEACLTESEVLAICRETCLALNSIQLTSLELFTTLCVTPETLTFNATGGVCFVDSTDVRPDEWYRPPEYAKFGNSIKGHLYSLGNTLWTAIEYNLSNSSELSISNELCDLLTKLCVDSIRERPTLQQVLHICDQHLGGLSSRAVCYELSSIGLGIHSSDPSASGNVTDVRKWDTVKPIFGSPGYSGGSELDEGFTDAVVIGEFPRIDNKQHQPTTTNAHLESMEDTGNSSEGSSENALAAFDQLSKRAQDILNKLYSPKTGNEVGISVQSAARRSFPEINITTGKSDTEAKTHCTDVETISESEKKPSSNIPLPKRKGDGLELGAVNVTSTSDEQISHKSYAKTKEEEKGKRQGFVPISPRDEGLSVEKSRKTKTSIEQKTQHKSKSQKESNSKSIQEILEVRNSPLLEEEIWALCRQCVLAIVKSKGVLPSYISLSSTLIKENGSVSYRSISANTSLDSMYLAPELQDQGILDDKTCLFGIAAMLWSAADWRLSPTQQPEITELLENLLIKMTQDSRDDRPSLDYVAKMCEEHETESGIVSKEVCQQLWKDGRSQLAKGLLEESLELENLSLPKSPPKLDIPVEPVPLKGFVQLTIPRLEFPKSESSAQYEPLVKQPLTQRLGLPERPSAFVSTNRRDLSDEDNLSEGHLSPLIISAVKERPMNKNASTGDLTSCLDKETSVKNGENPSLLGSRRNTLTDFRLPNAYSSQATHFTPIVLHHEKAKTNSGSNRGKSNIVPPDEFKQKIAKAMKLELMKPKPPANMVEDLENEVAEKDGRKSHKKQTSGEEGLAKKKHKSRSESSSKNTKHGRKDEGQGKKQEQRRHEKSGKRRQAETQKGKTKKDDESNVDKQASTKEMKDKELETENKEICVKDGTVSLPGKEGRSEVKGERSEVKGQRSQQEYITREQLVKDNANQPPQSDPQTGHGYQDVRQNPPIQMPVMQMPNLSRQQQQAHHHQMQNSPGTTPYNPHQISPLQMSTSPSQNIPTNPLIQMPGIYPNFPIQVALQQDPNTGLFNMVPIGVPYSGIPTVQGNTTQFSGMQNIQNISFPAPIVGLQYSPQMGQLLSSTPNSPTDSRGLKSSRENLLLTANKLTPTETDSDSDVKNTSKREPQSREYQRKKLERSHHTEKSKKHKKWNSNENGGSDSESSESSSYPRSDQKREKTNNHYSPNLDKLDVSYSSNNSKTMLDDLDDTRPLEKLKPDATSPASPTSISSLSRDSGVHMQSNLSSTEEVVNEHLTDALTVNSNLKRVIKLIRETYAFDGYLENGIEDVAMAKYITSLANLKWTTFTSAVSEKFCDLYWEEEVLEKLFEAVNGQEPVKTPKRSWSPRPRSVSLIKKSIQEDSYLATGNTALSSSSPNDDGTYTSSDNDGDDDDDDVVDDLLCGYEARVSPTPSTCSCTSAVMKSKVVADAKLFVSEKRYGEKSVSEATDETPDEIEPLTSEDKAGSAIDSLSDLIKTLSTEGESNDGCRPTSSEGSQQGAMHIDNVNSDVDDTRRPSLEVQDSDNNIKSLEQTMKSSDLHQSTVSLDSTSSGPRFIHVRSASESSGEDTEPHAPEVSGRRRLRKSPLLNPTTVRRSSSLSDSDSGSSSKKGNLRKVLSRTLSRHNSSASNSSSTLSLLKVPSTEDFTSLSMQNTANENPLETVKMKPNSTMFFDSDNVDPLIVDYTGQLVKQEDTQQSIEAKLSEVEQQLVIECRMKAKSEKFYKKLMESQRGKGKTGVDQKNMIPKVAKQIAEMSKKVNFLESAKRHLEMLYAEQWGLDHSLLYTFALCTSNEPMQFQPSSENPYLVFHSSKEGNTLQAGTPLGLFSYLFARQALLEGYLHHFFYTYRYFATAKELFKFITDRYNSAFSITSEEKEDRMKVHCRAMDIIQVWMEGFYEVDFRNDTELSQQLVHFIKFKVIPVDPQGEHLLLILGKHQSVSQKDEKSFRATPFETTTSKVEEDFVVVSGDTPMEKAQTKSTNPFKAAIGLRKRFTASSKKDKSKVGVVACVSTKDPKKFESGVYFAAQSLQRDWFSISEHLTSTLAYQMTLMQQEMFKKIHPTNLMNSRAFGVGVESTINPLFRRVSSNKQTTGDDVDGSQAVKSSSLFVENLQDEQIILTLLDYARSVSHWVSCEILCCSSVKAQIALLSKFIHLAKTCYELRNYDTCVQIIDGLDNLIIRQVPAWRSIPAKSNYAMQELTAAKMFLKSDSHCLVEGESHRDRPTLPCTLLFLMHVQQLEIGSFTLANGMYKWTKLRTIAKLVDQIRIFKEHKYDFEADPQLQSLIQQRIEKFKGQDLHMLASQQLSQFQLSGERRGQKFNSALKRVKASLQ